MTARDEAMQALRDSHSQWARDPHAGEFGEVMVDAIPPGVLVRLAIEQGALEVDHERYIIRRGRSEKLSLYRVVEP